MFGLWLPAGDMAPPAAVLLLALAVDAVWGDPPALWRIIPHPVALLGRGIAWVDARFNSPRPARAGVSGALVTLVFVALAFGAGWLLAFAARGLPAPFLIEALLASVLLAARGLYDHVAVVASALEQGLESGREAVGHIVGRDTAALDEGGVARAAIESAAENFSDGVVAPCFWFLVAGLPGLCAYKTVNTLDSMIGHRGDRHLYFGRVAARLDDAANWIPARIAGALIVGAALIMKGADARGAARCLLCEGGKHASPNAGRGEAPMAGALGVRLAGPRAYGSHTVDAPFLNEDGRDAARGDIARALRLYVRAVWLLAALIAGLALVWHGRI